jgi:hypothetical protein
MPAMVGQTFADLNMEAEVDCVRFVASAVEPLGEAAPGLASYSDNDTAYAG